MSADPARPAGSAADSSAAASAVTALYQQNAVGLIRLAMVMLGDRAAAEDVVNSIEDGARAAMQAVAGSIGDAPALHLDPARLALP
jgi:hypothetical protein